MINALIIWFIIVIVHGLTRAHATRPIVQVVENVTKVNYVERNPQDFIELACDFELFDEELAGMKSQGYDIKSWFFSNLSDAIPIDVLQIAVREHERNFELPFGPRKYIGKVGFKIVKPIFPLDEMRRDLWGRTDQSANIEKFIRQLMIENDKNPKRWGR